MDVPVIDDRLIKESLSSESDSDEFFSFGNAVFLNEPADKCEFKAKCKIDGKQKNDKAEEREKTAEELFGCTCHKKETPPPDPKPGEVAVFCSTCGEHIPDIAALMRHRRDGHTRRAVTYACSACDAKFARRSHLVAHRRLHTGDHPFTCRRCNKKFRSSTTLAAHARLQHADTMLRCQRCRKGFAEVPHLLLHMDTHARERR